MYDYRAMQKKAPAPLHLFVPKSLGHPESAHGGQSEEHFKKLLCYALKKWKQRPIIERLTFNGQKPYSCVPYDEQR